jgi:hypothetical protein
VTKKEYLGIDWGDSIMRSCIVCITHQVSFGGSNQVGCNGHDM